jgi:hypothetical protein
MNVGKLGVLILIVATIVFGVLGAAFGALSGSNDDDGGGGGAITLADADLRKNEADDDAVAVEEDDDDDQGDRDDTRGNDSTNGTATSGGASEPSQAAVLVEGRTAAQWMGSAQLYKQRWLRVKLANYRNARQVRNLRASRSQVRSQVRHSPSPRVVRGGGTGGGTSGGGTSGGGTGGGDT